MRIISLVLVIGLSGCATAHLTAGGQRVRFVSNSPHNCKYLGEVTGDFKGEDTYQGGVVTDEADFSKVDLKNNAAKKGADTVEVISAGRTARGEAYNCGTSK